MNSLYAVVKWVLPLVILGGAVAVFMILGGPEPPPRKEAETPRAVAVRTVAVEPQSGAIEIEADGVVVPLREVTLAAEVSGRVVEKSDACNEGQVVAKGDVLLRIDSRDYELDAERLEREVNQAELAIQEADEELAQNQQAIDLARRQVDLSRREVARLEQLKANKIVTESEYDRAVRDELTAANSLTAFEGQRRVLTKKQRRLQEGRSLASTMLEKAQLDLSRTAIVAPVAGTVVEDKVEQDSFVSKGTPLVTIEDTSAVEVRTSLRMDEVARVWRGRRVGEGGDMPEVPATIVFRIGDKIYEWDGMLERAEGRGLDEKTRTLPCRVRVSEPTRLRAIDRYGAAMVKLPADAPPALLRGMFVEVRLKVDVSDPLVSLPEEAVRPSGDVFVMRDGKLLVMHPQHFHAAGGRVLFDVRETGLDVSDRVVVSQLSNPREGMDLVEAAP